MIEFITVCVAIGAAIFAYRQAERATKVSKAAGRLEADRDILHWAAQVVEVLCQVHSLAQSKEGIAEAPKDVEALRTKLYALRDVGSLYFTANYDDQKNDPAINAILTVCELLRPDFSDADFLIIKKNADGVVKAAAAQDMQKGSKNRKNHVLAARIAFIEAMRDRIDTIRVRETFSEFYEKPKGSDSA